MSYKTETEPSPNPRQNMSADMEAIYSYLVEI